MKVRHEPPRPELELRVKAAIFLETPKGEIVRIDNWSLSEFQWPEGSPERPGTATLSIPFQDVAVRFPVRLQPSGSDGRSVFAGLSGRQRETLSLFYRSILSGRMASSGDMITSLDTPVDLVPMEETSEELEAAKPTRIPRAFRAAFSMFLYSTLAMFVLSYMGGQIWTRLDRIDIQHGRVVAETSVQVAAYSGFVKQVHAKQGDLVQEGQLLISLQNPMLEGELRQAETKHGDAVLAHAQIQNALSALDQAIEEIGQDAVERQVTLLIERTLNGRDYRSLLDLWREIRSDGLQLTHPVTVLRKTISGLETERAREVSKRLQELQDAQQALEASHIYAVTEGTVCEVLVREGEFLQPGSPAIDLEHQTERLAIGWVSPRLTETIFTGMPARVGLNDNGVRKSLPGEVVSVVAGDHPTRPGEFGIVVTVAISELSISEKRQVLQVGAPVNLAAEKRLLHKIWGSVRRLADRWVS